MAAESVNNSVGAETKTAPPILTVSVSPHIHSGKTTAGIMWTVILSLAPALAANIYFFGSHAAAVLLTSVLSCVMIEAACQKLLKRPVRVSDGSAVVTGILLAMVVPPGVPLYIMPLAAVMSIFVVKELVGGLGFNVFNPALVGRAFLVACFPVAMTTAYIDPMSWLEAGAGAADALSAATPLTLLKHGGMEAVFQHYPSGAQFYFDLVLGLRPGSLGETPALLLALGGIFLLLRGIITWHIPVAMMATVALFTWMFGGDTGLFSGNPLFHLLNGGIMLGAFYMATDYVTSPTTGKGKLAFGIGVGLLTTIIRLKGGYPEGVAYAILLMNPLTPCFERWFAPKRFAGPPKAKA
ncbi:MAG: RnfABCDGE type electron transport complex subunit D [Desulfarculales bacterium]|jgi:electron transport complex protein RnfD|nr:RnfABCDGE type electron transport complex subunit D [Desulfarculales bacterium]